MSDLKFSQINLVVAILRELDRQHPIHCRIGSSESNSDGAVERGAIHCRIGSSEMRTARYPSPPSTAGSLAENPDDIFLALRRYCAVQRTVRRTRDQVRRVRFFFHKKPAEAGSCASTQTVNPG